MRRGTSCASCVSPAESSHWHISWSDTGENKIVRMTLHCPAPPSPAPWLPPSLPGSYPHLPPGSLPPSLPGSLPHLPPGSYPHPPPGSLPPWLPPSPAPWLPPSLTCPLAPSLPPWLPPLPAPWLSVIPPLSVHSCHDWRVLVICL